MPINKFNTNLDLARQAKIYSGETAVFQGGIEMGMPFSGFPSGVDTNTIVSIGVGTTERATFSGTSATTIFDVTNLSSPSYNPTSTTLRVFPYSEINVGSSVVTVTATTYTPLLLSYTANTGVFNDPTNLVWGNPLLEKLYNNNSSGTTYPNDYFIELFNNIGEGIVGNTIALNETEYYQTESSNSIYSGGTFNMSIYETGTHGSFPTLVTGTTSGTVTENSATTYFWSDSQYLDETSGMTLPITTLSAATQTTEYDWTLTQSTIIDGNTIGLQYTGYNYTYSFANVSDVSTGTTPEYHGVTFATRENFSAGTLDYKGDLTWLDVKGNVNVDDRLTTNYLTINTLSTGSPVTMLAVDSSGNVVGGSGGTVDDTGAFTSTTINNRIIPTVVAGNVNDSNYSTIGGGDTNKIVGGPFNSFIGGGKSNIVSGNTYYSFVVGGQSNVLGDNTPWSNIGGGQGNNMNDSYYSSIVGGSGNLITNCETSFIGGGDSNELNSSPTSTIGGGKNNVITTSTRGSIGGGYENIVTLSRFSNINGGDGNQITGTTLPFIAATSWHTIGGGRDNFIHGKWNDCTIGGGKQNQILDTYTNPGYAGNTIGGGLFNKIDTFYGYNTIGGGFSNDILNNSARSFIGGGSGNLITSGSNSFIGGGQGNIISGITYQSSILGGRDNILDSNYSSIIGGSGNTLTHDNSFIIGTGLSSISANTTHVNKINIGTLGTGTSINNLGIDALGNVVTGTAGGGITIDAYNVTDSGTTITWDVSGTSTNYESTLTGNTTLDLSNVRNGDYGTILLTQDGVGSHTITLGTLNGGGTTHKVVSGGAGTITLTSTAGSTDILTFTYNGNTVWWSGGFNYS